MDPWLGTVDRSLQSRLSSAPPTSDCVTCQARNKKCDRARGHAGCRRCARAGIDCGGFKDTRLLKPRHSKRVRALETNIGPAPTVYLPSPAVNELTKFTRQINLNELSGDPAYSWLDNPNNSSRPADQGSTVLSIDTRGSGFLSPWWSDCLDIIQPQNSYPDDDSISSCLDMMYQQTPSPPAADHDINTISGDDDLVSPAIAKLLEGGFDLRLEEDVSESVISPAPDGRSTGRVLSNGSKPKPTKQTGPDDIDGLRYNEEVQQELLMALVLDREVESNIFAFVMHGYISWMSQFIFEPARILPEVQARTQLWIKHEPSQALLMSNVGLAVSRATDYDLTDFRAWEKMVLDDILQARACNLIGPEAMRVMKHFHKFMTDLRLVGSFSSVLTMMDMHAPIVRSACTESEGTHLNLPQALTGNINIQYYVYMDVLQSIVTRRPMFLRYDLNFFSSQVEDLLSSDDGPGFRIMWMYGIPDRLIVTFARMNMYLEDFGICVNPHIVQAIEKEIEGCGRIAWSGDGNTSTRMLGKITAHECWRLAAYVYLYMGLCGANSYDPRVVGVQKAFMRVLGGVKPTRYPDSFMVIPMFILGMATNTKDQHVLLARLGGVTECSRPGTMANDIMRMLISVWVHAEGRPISWSDLRPACLRVVGM